MEYGLCFTQLSGEGLVDVCVFQLQVRGIALSSARSDLGSKGISRSLPIVHKFGSGRNDGQSSERVWDGALHDVFQVE